MRVDHVQARFNQDQESPKKGRKLGPYQECLEAFKKGHALVLGLPYDESHYSRDTKVLKGPVGTYGAPAVCEMMGYFWREQQDRESGQESWIGKAAPHIPGFVKQIPMILRDYEVDSYGREEKDVRDRKSGPTAI